MPQSLHALGAHLVFSTKNRTPWLTDEHAPQIHAYMARILQNLECKQVTVGGHVDHIHILMNLTKKVAPMTVIETVKKDSSKFAKTVAPSLENFAWQTGYGLFGISASHFPAVRAYIARQAEHHHKETFQEELRRLLQEAGLQFDERYVWV